FDLYSTVLDQAYYGMDKETPKTNLAVEQTKDLIIAYNGQPIWALYHSNCGGKTIQGNLVFPNRLKPEDNYLLPTECPYQGKEWQTKIEFYTLKKILQKLTKNQVYSIDNIYVNNFKTYIVYNKEMVYSIYNWEIRKLVGYNVIRSPYITKISVNDDGIWIKGTGFGHGVGLCQFGANTLAKNGFNYKEILLYYYQNVEIVKIDEIFK
ncbi:MAG: SpoIID/LytB domain-containing protein, partial [bacterium]